MSISEEFKNASADPAQINTPRKQRRPIQIAFRKILKKQQRKGIAVDSLPKEVNCTADDTNTSGLSGMLLIREVMKSLHIVELIKKHIDVKKRKSRYGSALLTYLLIEQKIAGISAIEASLRLRWDAPYCELLDESSYPCPQTFRDHLGSMDMTHFDQVLALNHALLDLYATILGPRSLSLLIDTKVITVYGNQEGAEIGYNSQKRGRKSLVVKLAVLEEVGSLILHVDLGPGDDSCLTDFRNFFDTCVAALPKTWHIWEVKLDSGYYCEAVLEFLEGKGLTYLVSAKEYAPLYVRAHTQTDKLFEGTKGTEPRIIDFFYKPASWSKSRRFIVAKIYIRDTTQGRVGKQLCLFEDMEWRTQVIVTNHRIPARDCYKRYNGRAKIELTIKELTYGYGLCHRSHNSAIVNTLDLALTIIAYNLVSLIKFQYLPEQWRNKTITSLRRDFLLVPARISTTAHRLNIHLPKNYPFCNFFQAISEKMQMEVFRRDFLR